MSENTICLSVTGIEYVRELYPRIREDDAIVERYRGAIDALPPIVVARGRVLVDGFHRWQAHRREGRDSIEAIDLGNLTDIEIRLESIRRNNRHGHQLNKADKARLAEEFWRIWADLKPAERTRELCSLLSVSERTVDGWTKDARATEKARQKATAWDLWLECHSEREIAEALGATQPTIGQWVKEKRNSAEIFHPPASLQHFDVWQFGKADEDAGQESYFGRMPAQIVENLLWLYTEPGQMVFDPFAGGGTTIDVAKRMGRRVWASDLNPSTPNLPIHPHDMSRGWPGGAPRHVDLVLLDPPYWKQAAGRYSTSDDDLGNQDLERFMASWDTVLSACIPHIADGGFLAFIISPSVDSNRVVDHAFDMYAACLRHGLKQHRRIIATYNTQQASGQQVTWARENRELLKLYRDVVVLRK